MGQSGPVWARVAAALAIAIALTSCSSANGAPQPSEPATSKGSIPTATPTAKAPEPTADEQVTALWESVHTARLEQVYAQTDPDQSAFDDLATSETAALLVNLVGAARGDLPTVMTAVEFWPDITMAGNGREATVADCIIVSTRPADDPDGDTTSRTQVWTGTAERRDDGWRLDSIQLGQDSCVPAQLQTELLGAYEEWHEATNVWWDPPNPDHPLLEQHMVDPGLSDMRQLLSDHRSMRIAVRDSHDLNHAVVFELGVGRARISDCYPAATGDIAAYDPETGDRREDLSPTPRPGQIDRTILDLERTSSGTWKASGWRAETKSDCAPGGTPYAVAP